MTYNKRMLPGHECLSWARSRPWSTESERLFSPKETLKTATWASENGTQRTPR
jgi:hypothetical protein